MTNEGECEQEYARSARDERTEATDGAVRVIRRAPTGTAKAMVDGCDLMIFYVVKQDEISMRSKLMEISINQI